MNEHDLLNHIHLTQHATYILLEKIKSLDMPEATRDELLFWISKIPNIDDIDGIEHEDWDRKVDKKSAEWELLRSILSHKKAGLPLWYLLKLTARMWENPQEEMMRMMHERI